MNEDSSDLFQETTSKPLNYFPDAVISYLQQTAFENRLGNEGKFIMPSYHISNTEKYSMIIAIPLSQTQSVNDLMSTSHSVTLYHFQNNDEIAHCDITTASSTS